jgi:uncharacterized protein YbbC (DUF1343 family)
MLMNLDVLVIDLQDVGVRAYTYVSAMRLSMEACFQAGIHVVVLDRPNPIGGLKVDGPILEERWESYVGPFPTPYVHGLTIGELAHMARAQPGWLELDRHTRARGKLTVIPMRGWRRQMMWPDTGLPWIRTSPAIADLSAALGFSMTGLGCQIGGFSHGHGAKYLFRVLRYPGKSPEQIAETLESKEIRGLAYPIIGFKDKAGKEARAVYVQVRDWQQVRPTEISFYLMQIACLWGQGNPFSRASRNNAALFNKHVGSTEWWDTLTYKGSAINVREFIQQWDIQARAFQAFSKQYWLYF